MRDIARAAEVSEQTLYNYFPTKEHLVFDLDQEFEERLVDLVRHRRPGMTIASAVEREARRQLGVLLASMTKPTGIPESAVLSAALRRVWIQMNARAADRLAEALRKDEREPHGAAAAAMAARSIVAIFAVVLEQVGVAALAGRSPQSVRRELTTTLATVVERGALALGDQTPRPPVASHLRNSR